MYAKNTSGDLAAARQSFGANFAAWLTNIIAPAWAVPSATCRSASLLIRLKLPTGAVIAGSGSGWPNKSMEISGSATS